MTNEQIAAIVNNPWTFIILIAIFAFLMIKLWQKKD